MHTRIPGLALLATAMLAGCSSGTSDAPAEAPGGRAVQINGAGATFPSPLYTKWFGEYNRLHPNVRINYQSLGSGAGIRQLTSRTVFFGATDDPMGDAELHAAPGPILHLPTVLGAVVPVYNLPGLSRPLNFTGALLADIILGRVTKWNDAALARANPDLSLPDTSITVVHRSDGSGTTFIFTDFLSKVSPEFKKTVGADAAVSWPVGVGGKGNEGVAGLVQQTPGSIGYIELIYALQNRIAYASVQNSAGTFVAASNESVTAAAAEAAAGMPADFRVSITNPAGVNAYPIASFTWILLYEQPEDKAQGKIMVDFMRWALTDGQAFATDLGYASLPKNVVDMELTALNRIAVQ